MTSPSLIFSGFVGWTRITAPAGIAGSMLPLVTTSTLNPNRRGRRRAKSGTVQMHSKHRMRYPAVFLAPSFIAVPFSSGGARTE